MWMWMRKVKQKQKHTDADAERGTGVRLVTLLSVMSWHDALAPRRSSGGAARQQARSPLSAL